MAKPRSAKKGPTRPPAPEELPSDLDMPEDAFHRQKDKLALDINDDVLSADDSLDEDEVLGLEEEEEDSEELDTDEEEERETTYGRREFAIPLPARLGSPLPHQQGGGGAMTMHAAAGRQQAGAAQGTAASRCPRRLLT